MHNINYSFLDDTSLLNRYRSTAEVACVGELFRRYKHLVLGVCLKYLKNAHDSEDAVMEIFEKLHLDLKKADVGHFKSWLYTVARNHCLMKMRKAGLSVEFPETLPQNGEDTEGALDDLKLKEVMYQKLETGLEMLKPEQRLCLDLFFLKDKSYKEIMRDTGLSLNEVKTHIQNGKLNLKKMLSRLLVIGALVIGYS
jgi:RNA polymerase sigma-70 factor (ECF subfamily)